MITDKDIFNFIVMIVATFVLGFLFGQQSGWKRAVRYILERYDVVSRELDDE